MTFKKWSLALVALALVVPVSASALGISVVGVTYSGNALMENGDTVTVALLLENSGGEALQGLDVGVFGYDEGALGLAADNHVLFESAVSSTRVFNDTWVDPPGIGTGGLAAAAPISESGNAITSEERFVRIFGGVTDLLPATGDGTNDNGVGPFPGPRTDGIAGGVHFQVTFSAQSLGATPGSPAQVILDFGVGQQGFIAASPTEALPFTNDQLTLTIVPEPGTALLMGLGLAGLAGVRRR